ncbi:MAG: FKBP-type peptidyl-prolyl cis-trans isomerase [Steroidobacteraceae bacterium]
MTRRLPRLLTAVACLCLGPAAIGQQPATPAEPAAPPASAEALLVTDLAVGLGDEAWPGMIAVVHYTGWLYDPGAAEQRGQQFDSSRERGRPFSFPLGGGHVIRGWEQGVPGMKVGGKRRLVISPALAYGARNIGNGLIPPNSTLLFEIELMALESVTLTPQSK